MVEAGYGGAVKILRNGKNLGFPGGVNAGISSSGGEFIALLNSDAYAEKDWLEKMIAAIRLSEKTGMCACKIYLHDRPRILDNTGEVLYRDGLNRPRGRLEEDTGQYDSDKKVLCPSGCAALYRRTLLDEVDKFDERFFLYGEDLDIGLRGRMLGYECMYVPGAVAFHRLSASAGTLSSLKAFYVERNRLWVLIKCFPLPNLLASPGYTVVRYLYILYGLLSRKGPASQYAKQTPGIYLAWILIRAYFSTLWHLPYLLNERSRWKKKNKISLQEFNRWLRIYGISAKDAALKDVI